MYKKFFLIMLFSNMILSKNDNYKNLILFFDSENIYQGTDESPLLEQQDINRIRKEADLEFQAKIDAYQNQQYLLENNNQKTELDKVKFKVNVLQSNRSTFQNLLHIRDLEVKVKKASKKVAKDRGAIVVVYSFCNLYINPSNNITDEVVNILNQEYIKVRDSIIPSYLTRKNEFLNLG